MTWQQHASCRDEDPELFFPIGTSGPALLQIAEAKTVCGRCPVQPECLAESMHLRLDHGIWGGMSKRERSVLRRRASSRQPNPVAA